MAPPTEVQPRSQVEPSGGGYFQLEAPGGAILHGHRDLADEKASVQGVVGEVRANIRHPLEPAVDMLNRAGDCPS
jgi:hypothetical protein